MSDREKFDPVAEWLGAYLDGELNEERRDWVEGHLATCAGCRRELEELRALTTLLHADPAPRPVTSSDAFARGIQRQLSKSIHPGWRGGLRSLVRYAPLGLLTMWAFLQAVVWVSGGLLLGLNLLPGGERLLSQLVPLTGPSTGATLNSWLNGALLGSNVSGALNSAAWVAEISWLNPFTLISIVITMLFAALFLAWMAGVWVARSAEKQAVFSNINE